MSTKVVNVRLEKCDLSIGRKRDGTIPDPPQKGCFGNPFKLTEYTREESLALYKDYFLKRLAEDDDFRQAVLSLRGKKLGCFCKPLPCHGDVIKEWLDEQGEVL